MTHLKPGDEAPNFNTQDEKGNSLSLSSFKGKKVILFFYPKANTPGCTAESCNLRDNYSLLKEKGFEILGVSADTQKAQKKFTEKYNFPFPLIPDTEKEVVKAYGVWGPKKFMGRSYEGIYRTTFIISENGKIERVISNVRTKDHTEQILEEISK